MADREPKTRYTSEIQAMMYTFGDVRTPLPVTAQLIEQIIKKQLINLVIYLYPHLISYNIPCLAVG